MNDDTQPVAPAPEAEQGDATGVALSGETMIADGVTRESTLGEPGAEPAPLAELADMAGTLVDSEGKPIDPPPGDVNDEPAVIGASIEEAAPAAAPVDVPHVPEEAEAADLGRPADEVVEPEPAAPVVPMAFEKSVASVHPLDVASGLVWDMRDENRPSEVARIANLNDRASKCAPYLALLAESEVFEPHAVLHTPFGSFAIDSFTNKDLLDAHDNAESAGQLVRLSGIHRVNRGGTLHTGYVRHEVATALVMALTVPFALEPWPMEKPDPDALALAKENAVKASAAAALDA